MGKFKGRRIVDLHKHQRSMEPFLNNCRSSNNHQIVVNKYKLFTCDTTLPRRSDKRKVPVALYKVDEIMK